MVRKEPDADLLLALVDRQLRKAKHLAHELVFYDRARPFDAARSAVQRKRAEFGRDAVTDAPKAAAIKDKCKVKSKGGDAENEKAMPRAPCFRFQKLVARVVDASARFRMRFPQQHPSLGLLRWRNLSPCERVLAEIPRSKNDV